MKSSLTYFAAGRMDRRPSGSMVAQRESQSKQDVSAFLGIGEVKAAKQQRMRTARPLSNCLICSKTMNAS